MSNYKTIIVKTGEISSIILNRPAVHNAMNEIMISELTQAFTEIQKNDTVRVIVLRGEGKSFCAGADINYMKNIASFGYDENFEDGLRLANLFKTIYYCKVPTIALVHGAAFGGANGLLASCDIAIADNETTFAFSEVKIGIGPATISPFVIKRIGEFNARDLMLTGRRFKGNEAEKMGLVTRSVEQNELESILNNYLSEFLSSAPKAVKFTKQIISHIVNQNLEISEEIDYTASSIAKLRAEDEGQEGMAAFLEKRKPNWFKKNC